VLESYGVQGGLMLVLARGAAVATLLSVFGTLLFCAAVAPRAYRGMGAGETSAVQHRLRRLALYSIASCLVALCAWLAVQAASMAEATSPSETLAALPAVASHTRFGHLVLLQAAGLAAIAACLAWWKNPAGDRVALGAATLVTLLQVGHSHAASMQDGPVLLLLCDALHLLGAGAWLGGLLPLLLLVRHAPPRAGAMAARWFSPLGKACIAALVISALYQGWVLVASIPGLIGTAYGVVVLAKLALFGVLLGFAAANRYRFAPALLGAAPEPARAILVRSIALQSGFAVAIVLAAATLSQLPPSMHTQPWWPFAQRISLAAVREDPDIFHEVLGAALMLAAAAILLVASCVLRRGRWPVVAIAVTAAWFAIPHVAPLLVDAYPTSFYHSPTDFSAETIVSGARVFAQNCVACHGQGGAGDGPAAKSLPIPPADLTATHLWMHDDGELFWWLSHGIDNPAGGLAMPGFAAVLDTDQRWAVIDYIRAHNAGAAAGFTGTWPLPVRAPAFTAACDGRQANLGDLGGRYVRLVLLGSAPQVRQASKEPAALCVTSDPTAVAAYAIASGGDPAAMAGSQFLIDDKGWLRAMQKQDSPSNWDDPRSLAASIAALRAHPIGDAMPMQMDMKM
jgi:putative copper export protein/mono/diheme cytochrome c family protein